MTDELDPDAWQVEPHPIDPELTDEFEAEPYNDPWNSIMERIDGASKADLMALYGFIPTWRDTEIGGE
jgi:hypothetical protein